MIEQQIKEADEAYLAKHDVKGLVGELLGEVVTQRPLDPVQYMVDHLSLGAASARQDVNGLSAYRRDQLMRVFRAMDAKSDGTVDFGEITAFVGKHGGGTVTERELLDIFADFDTDGDARVDVYEFMRFFGRFCRTLSNAGFDQLIVDMLA